MTRDQVAKGRIVRRSYAQRSPAGNARPLIWIGLAALVAGATSAQALVPAELRGQWGGPSYTVVASGQRIYAGMGPSVLVFDASQPPPLVRTEQAILPGFAHDMALVGDYLYVAAGTAGLQILNVSGPASPVSVGYLDVNGDIGETEAVAVAGNYAYVAGWPSALQIIDISNPASPLLVGSCSAGGVDIAVSGNYAYVAGGGADEVRVVDVSNPASPVQVGSYETVGYANAVAVSGQYLYLGEERFNLEYDVIPGGLRVLDVSNPASPVRIGRWDSYGDGYGVILSGNTVYLADGRGGLRVINISNPALPSLVGTCATADSAHSVAISGNRAYVADENGGLQLIDITDPSAPSGVSEYKTSEYTRGVAANGHYVYLADDLAGLHVIDVSDPAVPVRVGGYYDAAPSSIAFRVAIQGQYAYLAKYTGLDIIEVSNPASPARVGRYIASDVRDVALWGSCAYVVSFGGQLRVVDVSNPASPSLIGSCYVSNSLRSVAVMGNHVYIAAGRTGTPGIHVVDVSNPAAPVVVGGYSTRDAQNVYLQGNYAYVADRTGLRILDISQPASPVLVGSYPAGAEAYVSDVIVSGSYAYLSCAGLSIVDVSDPASPAYVGGNDQGTCGYVDLAMAGNDVFGAATGCGLVILHLRNPDFDRDNDVDQDDLDHFEACATGTAVGPPAANCHDADLDGDGDIDQSDFGVFQRCLSGQDIPADPNCED